MFQKPYFFEEYRLVAYNAPFDMAFLERAAAKVDRRIDNPVSDALVMARKAFPGLKSYKLSKVAGVAGLASKDAHRALADCKMTAVVYGAVAAELGRVD